MDEIDIPKRVRIAKRKFHKQRAEYYAHVAAMLRASKGATKLLDLFEKDASRYGKTPRGVLSAYWLSEYDSNGANLAEAWAGTLPDDEVALVQVGAHAGPGGLESSLEDLARIAALNDKMAHEGLMTMLAAFAGLTIALLMLTVFPIASSGQIKSAFGFMPVEAWGKLGQGFVAYAEGVKAYGIFVFATLAALVYAVVWAIPNTTGELRDKLDQKLFFLQTYRDLKGAMFLTTMATLTRKRGTVMFTLRDALMMLKESLKTPWIRWRVQEVIDGVDASGAVDVEAFNTNLISKEMFYFLRDIQETSGLAEAFEKTGVYVEQSIVKKMIAKLTVYRWAILLTGVVIAAGIGFWQTAVIFEMKGAMQLYYSSR